MQDACGAFTLEEDASVFHMVADRHYTWEPGTTLDVVFMDGRAEDMRKVAEVAKEWTKYANIDFAFHGPGDAAPRGAQLRVSFRYRGYWSLIGSQATYRDSSRPTMNLASRLFGKSEREIQRVVLHEFGHALGLRHEHQNPNADFTWNKDVIYEYYERTHGWSKATVDSNIFDTLDRDRVNATAFDRDSIMAYSFPRNFTVEGVRIPYRFRLSATDKREIAALYPGRTPTGIRPPPDRTELARLRAAVRFAYSIESNGQKPGLQNYAIAVAAPTEVMDRIDHVLYQRQHRTFPEFQRRSHHRSAGRAHGFAFGWQGWGWVPVRAKVVWKSGQVTEHVHRDAPRRVRQGPDWAAIKRSVRFDYSATAGRGRWRTYRIELASQSARAHIHWIDYQRQHATFSEFKRGGYLRRDARADSFALTWRGYGWVPVTVRVHFKDGDTREYRLTEAPRRR